MQEERLNPAMPKSKRNELPPLPGEEQTKTKEIKQLDNPEKSMVNVEEDTTPIPTEPPSAPVSAGIREVSGPPVPSELEPKLPVIAQLEKTPDRPKEVDQSPEPVQVKTETTKTTVTEVTSDTKPSITIQSEAPSNKLIMFFIILLMVAIAIATAFLVYIESTPSPVKAFNAVKDSLVEVQTARFELQMTFDMQSTDPSGVAADATIALSGVGEIDAAKKQAKFVGSMQTASETLNFEQVVDVNNVYIKYEGRDYVVSTDKTFAVFSDEDFALHNMLAGEEGEVDYGYGSVDNSTGADAYRFRYYPPTAKIQKYLASYLGDLISSFYQVNKPVITASDITFGDFGWRVWSDTGDYHPRKIEIKVDTIAIDLGDLGEVAISNFVSSLDLENLNAEVEIVVPVV